MQRYVGENRMNVRQSGKFPFENFWDFSKIGAFPEGVNEKNIITHPSTPRNKLIAETLQRLKYVQRTGQGVDIIFREMISSGKPYPHYHAYNEAVILTIFSAIDNVNFVKFIASEQDKLQ